MLDYSLVVSCPTLEAFQKVAKKADVVWVAEAPLMFNTYTVDSVIFVKHRTYGNISYAMSREIKDIITHYEYLGEFPDRWVIKWESLQMLKELKSMFPDFLSFGYVDGAYSGYDKFRTGRIYFSKWDYIPTDYILLTIEQVRNIIKNKSGMKATNGTLKGKKLLGYNCTNKITPQEAGRILKCDNTLTEDGCFFGAIDRDNVASDSPVKRAMDMGVFDIWFEPVYEEDLKSEKITLGSNGTEFTIKANRTIAVNRNGAIRATITVESVQRLATTIERLSLPDIYPWYSYIDYDARFIRIGCEDENNLFSYNEIIKLLEIYKNLNP